MMFSRRLFADDNEDSGGGGARRRRGAAAVEELPVIGPPVQGLSGWFHPGPGDKNLPNTATHTPEGDDNPFIKINGFWIKTSIEEIDRLGVAGILAKSKGNI